MKIGRDGSPKFSQKDWPWMIVLVLACLAGFGLLITSCVTVDTTVMIDSKDVDHCLQDERESGKTALGIGIEIECIKEVDKDIDLSGDVK